MAKKRATRKKSPPRPAKKRSSKSSPPTANAILEGCQPNPRLSLASRLPEGGLATIDEIIDSVIAMPPSARPSKYAVAKKLIDEYELGARPATVAAFLKDRGWPQ